MSVRAKKHLGQHFLTDESICERIAEAVKSKHSFTKVLEVGPGTGALTKYLLAHKEFDTEVVELDRESVAYLKVHYPQLNGHIHEEDFLQADLSEMMGEEAFAIVGNFPYYISSQILFKALDYKDQVPLIVGMFQKEVAERITTGPGSKTYGVISVFLQAFYEVEYLFTVDEHVFFPPPKVKSAVIRLSRNDRADLGCDEKFFRQVVKMAFNQRRKTLRNSLKPLLKNAIGKANIEEELLNLRPERLSVSEFIHLTQQLRVET